MINKFKPTVWQEGEDCFFRIDVQNLARGEASLLGKMIRTAIYMGCSCYRPVAIILDNGKYVSPFSVCDGIMEDISDIQIAVEDLTFNITGERPDYIILSADSKSSKPLFSQDLSTAEVEVKPNVKLVTNVKDTKFNLGVVLCDGVGSRTTQENMAFIQEKFPDLAAKCIPMMSVHKDIVENMYSIEDVGNYENLCIVVSTKNIEKEAHIKKVIYGYISSVCSIFERSLAQ